MHAGFTIGGRRQVQYARVCDGVQPDATVSSPRQATVPSPRRATVSSPRPANVAWEAPVPQAPGDFYVGNLRAPWHRVVHGERVEAEPLFDDACGSGVLVTVMLRADVFRANRARIMSHKAGALLTLTLPLMSSASSSWLLVVGCWLLVVGCR